MTDWLQLVDMFPPSRPPLANDWAAFESSFGTALPSDYKKLVETYGYGRFNNFLTVFLPSSPHDFVELGTQRGIAGDKFEFLREYDEVGSSALPVDPGELLPAAGTDNGNTVYWRMKPSADPDAWGIAVDQARGDEWFFFDGGIVAFLVIVFVHRVRVPVFPESLTARPSTFTQVE